MSNHLSDHDLVLALDRELPVQRQALVDAHLLECLSCTARRAALEQASKQTRAFCRMDGVGAEQIETSRYELRRKLTAIARSRQTSFAERLGSFFLRMPRWAVISAAAIATVLVAGIWPVLGPGTPASNRSLERDSLPIASLTPGATRRVTVDEVCAPDGVDERQVSNAVRDEVLREYRMASVPSDQYELDYLITPELGGAPSVQNLWPQRYTSRTWNAAVKDQLEDLLPKLVCSGTISLQTAQRDIAANWIAAYKKYFRTDVPLQQRAYSGQRASDRRGEIITYSVRTAGNAPVLRLIASSLRGRLDR